MIPHDVPQRSPAWYALRLGKPTASEFSKLVTSEGKPSKQLEGYATTLAVELFAGKPVEAWEGNLHTERGRELEETALARYAFSEDVEVIPVGFITDDKAIMGCSPDGLIGDFGMVEAKCLKAENHAKAIRYYEKHGRCPPDYVQQTQGQLLIADRRWCDLIFYHPELPLLVIRQEPDLRLYSLIEAGVEDVIAERNQVLAMLRRRQGSSEDGAPTPMPPNLIAPPRDLAKAAPLF